MKILNTLLARKLQLLIGDRTLTGMVLAGMILFGMIPMSQAATPASAAIAWHPGFVIRAEDRFDPAIQRLMAEYSLQSLPLERGQLYYLYPIGVTPRLEGVQIRYLESLLDKQRQRMQQLRKRKRKISEPDPGWL